MPESVQPLTKNSPRKSKFSYWRAERSQVGLAAGLVIEDAAGPAQAAGVQPGDVLLSVNGKPVTSVQQVRDVVKGSSKSVALLIQRGDDRIFIPVRIG